MVAIAGADIGEARHREHFGHLFQIILYHLLVIVIVVHRYFQLGDAIGVFLVGVEGHVVAFLRDGFAHDVRTHPPVAGCGIVQTMFQGCALPAVICLRAAVGTKARRVTAQKVSFLLKHIPETRNITAVGSATVGGRVEKSFVLARHAGPVVMKGKVLTQCAAVVAETVGESRRSGVE